MAAKNFNDALSHLNETKQPVKQKVQPNTELQCLDTNANRFRPPLQDPNELDEEDYEAPEDAINLPTIKIPPLAQAGEHDSDEKINRQHLQMSNLELNVIYAMWPQVKSISSVCKLIDASIKAVKHQRDLLCLPYGYRGEATRKDVVFPPIED